MNFQTQKRRFGTFFDLLGPKKTKKGQKSGVSSYRPKKFVSHQNFNLTMISGIKILEFYHTLGKNLPF